VHLKHLVAVLIPPSGGSMEGIDSLAVSMLRRFSSIFIISSGLLCICKVTNYLGIKCSEAKKSAKKSLKVWKIREKHLSSVQSDRKTVPCHPKVLRDYFFRIQYTVYSFFRELIIGS
jgi:hypothetical protein